MIKKGYVNSLMRKSKHNSIWKWDSNKNSENELKKLKRKIRWEKIKLNLMRCGKKDEEYYFSPLLHFIQINLLINKLPIPNLSLNQSSLQSSKSISISTKSLSPIDYYHFQLSFCKGIGFVKQENLNKICLVSEDDSIPEIWDELIIDDFDGCKR